MEDQRGVWLCFLEGEDHFNVFFLWFVLSSSHEMSFFLLNENDIKTAITWIFSPQFKGESWENKTNTSIRVIFTLFLRNSKRAPPNTLHQIVFTQVLVVLYCMWERMAVLRLQRELHIVWWTTMSDVTGVGVSRGWRLSMKTTKKDKTELARLLCLISARG